MKILSTRRNILQSLFLFLPLQEMSPQVRLSTDIVPFALQCLPLCCSSKNSHSRRLSCFPPPQETEHDSHSPQSPQTPSTIKDKLSLCQGKTSSRYYVKHIDPTENDGNNENNIYLVSGMIRCYSLVRLRFDQHRKRFPHWIHTFRLL